jgi:hypothetical protein
MQPEGSEQPVITGTDTFTAYAVGMFYASACTSLDDTEATDRINREHPAEAGTPWRISAEPFRTGEPNGRPCDQRPTTHRHLLFN